MKTPTLRAFGAAIGLAAALLVARSAVEAVPTPGPVEPTATQDKRAELMRLKLDYAKNVLEGLTLEKMDLVADNARELKLLSAAAEWEPATVPGPLYLTYTREFQRIADAMAKSAREQNLDGATLAYVQMATNCVECHKYVRSTRR